MKIKHIRKHIIIEIREKSNMQFSNKKEYISTHANVKDQHDQVSKNSKEQQQT